MCVGRTVDVCSNSRRVPNGQRWRAAAGRNSHAARRTPRPKQRVCQCQCICMKTSAHAHVWPTNDASAARWRPDAPSRAVGGMPGLDPLLGEIANPLPCASARLLVALRSDRRKGATLRQLWARWQYHFVNWLERDPRSKMACAPLSARYYPEKESSAPPIHRQAPDSGESPRSKHRTPTSPKPPVKKTTKTTLRTNPPHPHHPIIPGSRQHVGTGGVPAHRVRVARVTGVHPAKLRQRSTLHIKREQH